MTITPATVTVEQVAQMIDHALLRPELTVRDIHQGCAVAAQSIKLAVMTAIYTQVNARLQMDALRLGEPKYLTQSEIETMTRRQQTPLASERAWEYWRQRAGASDL